MNETEVEGYAARLAMEVGQQESALYDHPLQARIQRAVSSWNLPEATPGNLLTAVALGFVSYFIFSTFVAQGQPR